MAREPRKAAAKRASSKKATGKKANGKAATTKKAAENDVAQEEATYHPNFLSSEPSGVEEDPGTANGGERISTVNQQIIDTIQQSAQAVKDGEAGVIDAAINAAMAHSLTMAIQDATEHLRRTQSLAEAGTAMGLKRIADGAENGQDIIDAANGALTSASQSLAEIGNIVAKIRKDLDIA